MSARPEREARLVLSTTADLDSARGLARTLVEERLAACCNLVGGLTSVYRWQGAVEEAAEVLLVIKTSAARLAALEARLAELHPYDVPELVVLTPERVAPDYLAWLLEAVD